MLKHYSIIGLIISLIIVSSSCTDGYYPLYGEYYFVNNTNYTITSDAKSGLINVAPNSTAVYKEKLTGEKRWAEVSNYVSPLKHYSYDVNIKFNSTKCLMKVKEEDVHSIRDIKNYVAEKVNENTYKFTYMFTEADYNRATTCP